MKIRDNFGKEINMYNMYGAYHDFKKLYEFYQKHKNMNITPDEMRDRVAYILKRGTKQRTEIETICWILGEDLVDIKK